ncbi:Ref family recombination enhancement nuclease [Serratia quinivorans]
MRKADEKHVQAVVELGCIACYLDSGQLETPAEVHHVRAGQGAAQRASWKKVLPLCPDHHRLGMNGKIAIHRGAKTFSAKYGSEVELLHIVESLVHGGAHD